MKLTDFGLSRIGFLDRRVRDELTTVSYHDRVQPISPAPSRSGTPPQSPAELPSTPNGGAYRHSYFSLLFDQGASSSASTSYSGTINNEEAIINPASPDTRGPERRHRRHLSALSESMSSGITPTSASASRTEKVAREETAPRAAVGTPDYLAPESILGTGQDSMVDWVSCTNKETYIAWSNRFFCSGLLVLSVMNFCMVFHLFMLIHLIKYLKIFFQDVLIGMKI